MPTTDHFTEDPRTDAGRMRAGDLHIAENADSARPIRTR